MHMLGYGCVFLFFLFAKEKLILMQNNLFILLRSAIKNKSDYVRNATHPKHNYRDKADPFTTSSKILAKYESDHLIRNI